MAVQTNLSCPLQWLDAANASKVGFWCTYHPAFTTLEAFLMQCDRLEALGVSYSAGCVGLREHLADIRRLRDALPPERYVWINAYKDVEAYYDDDTLTAFRRIDPLFPLNNIRHPSRGQPCRCGSRAFVVDGNGDVRRCHFVNSAIGNIYQDEFPPASPSPACPNATCGCHIGYVHLVHLGLDSVFGDGLLERVPETGVDALRHADPFATLS